MDHPSSDSGIGKTFISFVALVKNNYDGLIANGRVDNAKILESAWRDLCMAGVPAPCKTIAFRNPNALSLTALRDMSEYLSGNIQPDVLRRCATYLEYLTEARPMYEYMSACTAMYINPWEIHTDAAYIYCKLRVCGAISRLLTSNDPAAVDYCRAIDDWVLSRIQSAHVCKYTRLADNRTTFASIVHFCKYAIDTKRDSQEYLCGLVELVDQFNAVLWDATQSRPVDAAQSRPLDAAQSHPIDESDETACADAEPIEFLREMLMGRYTKEQMIRIAHVFGLDPELHKRFIIDDMVKKLGNKANDHAWVNARIAIWLRSMRKRRRR